MSGVLVFSASISDYSGIYSLFSPTVTIYNPLPMLPYLIATPVTSSSRCEITNIWRVIYSQAVMINSAAERACGQPREKKYLVMYESEYPTRPTS